MSRLGMNRAAPALSVLVVSFIGLTLAIGIPATTPTSHALGTTYSQNVHATPDLGSPKYNVTFTETGLPSTALSNPSWYVILGWWFSWDPTAPLGSHSILLSGVTAGNWPLLFSGTRGYVPVVGVGTSLNVSGNHYDLSYNVSFVPGRTANLYWSEKGLPATLGLDSRGWCVDWSFWPTPFSCTGLPISGILNLPLGDYSYRVVSPTVGQTISAQIGKESVPVNGTLTLTSNTDLQFVFVYRYTITFTETGLTPGTNWSVTVNGHQASPRVHTHLSRDARNSTITLFLPNGTYHFRVGPGTGFIRTPAGQRFQVNGADLTFSITFRPRS